MVIETPQPTLEIKPFLSQLTVIRDIVAPVDFGAIREARNEYSTDLPVFLSSCPDVSANAQSNPNVVIMLADNVGQASARPMPKKKSAESVNDILGVKWRNWKMMTEQFNE